MKLKPQFRNFEVRGFDEEKRTIELSFSSEEPYERYWGVEILDHSTTSVDMSRLNDGAPLLFNHDRNVIVGVVENAKIENKRGLATVRFGNSTKAKEVFSDVVDGIMKNVSVGYQIVEMILESKNDSVETFRVTKWQPFEISIVSIPADNSVGVGRGAEDLKESEVNVINQNEKQNKTGEKTMNEEERKAAIAAEKARVRELSAIGSKYNMNDLAQKAIEDDSTVDSFRAIVLEKLGTAKPVDTKSNNVLTDEETRAYSLGRAIQAAISGDWSNATVEREASAKVAKMLGKDARGFYVPHQVLQRELNTTGGAAVISTTDGGASFVELLRKKLVLAKLGGTVLSGLSGNVAIPKQTGTATAYWIAEGANTTASDIGLGMIELTPKTVSAKTALTRQMLLQSNRDIEALVMNDLTTNIALAIDAAAIAGTGADGQPRGILNTTGIGAVDCSLGLTFAKVVELETKIAAADADAENMSYVAGAGVTGKLKTTPIATGNPKMLLENNEVNGYKHTRSNQIPANSILFGDFSQVITGLWGGLDLMIDQYTLADSGSVVIRAFQSVDIGVRHPESFAATNNIPA